MTEQHEEPSHKNTVESKDGTLISYNVTGSGPGLIIIPGVMAVAAHYATLAEELGKNFTVYTIERRGRGFSGPQGNAYTMAKECEDIQALQESTLASYLFGHSYGGLIALDASKQLIFKKTALYEPGVSIKHSLNTTWIPPCKHYLHKKQYLNALAVFTRCAAHATVRLLPLWVVKAFILWSVKKQARQDLYELLPSTILEHTQILSKNDTYSTYQNIEQPILIATGGKTKLKWPALALHSLKAVLPKMTHKKIPGLDHFGPVKEGVVVANELKNYFLNPSS